jgi:hypothetical protein
MRIVADWAWRTPPIDVRKCIYVIDYFIFYELQVGSDVHWITRGARTTTLHCRAEQVLKHSYINSLNFNLKVYSS